MEIINFLLPIHFSPFRIDLLPLIFFLVIWGLFIFTIVQVYRKAKPENWENNWYGGDVDNTANDLDAEHGSVMDISNAVATSSERIADIMPGMILIIGLLGTFLGLGLALDKASGILTGANAMSNMDASMTQLMGMMEGLGTKFKTSTWGLLAFILLKVILSKNGYEERRLYWSIEKVKGELDLTREKQLLVEQEHNQKIVNAIETLTKHYLMDNSSQKIIDAIQLSHNENKSFLNDLVIHGRNSSEAMIRFIERNEATVDILGQSAAGMSQAAKDMGDSATHLQGVIDSFRTNMQDVVNLMKKDLNSTIKGMNESFSKNMSSMSQGLNTATQDISNAVNSLSSNVDETMKSVTSTINESMSLQKTSQDQFTVKIVGLRKEILAMTKLVEELTEGINDQFGAVTNGIKRTEHVGKNIVALTDTVNGAFKDSLQSIESVTALKPTLENLTHGIDLQTGLLNQIATNTASNQQKNNKPRKRWGNNNEG